MTLPAQPNTRWLLPLALMAVTFWFSAQPYDGHEMAWWEVVGRNLGHFGGYALLAATWVWALGRATRRNLALAGVLALAYAIADEYHQTFVDGRDGTWQDVVLDGLGIATALALINQRAQAAKTKQIKDAGRSPKRTY